MTEAAGGEGSRPRCRCHGEPMLKDGLGGHGRPQWKCARLSRARNARRVRMGAGGIAFYVGHASTTETAAQLRQRIKEEAPK